jgi:hypothetical protein
VCADAGLMSVGVLAVDGSKFAADASDSAIRTYEQIAAEILQETHAVDVAEDDIHGRRRVAPASRQPRGATRVAERV